MNVLVSGATGFVGSAVTRHLLASGHEVRAMTRSGSQARARFERDEPSRRALAEGRLTFVEADVTRPGTLDRAVAGVEAVVQAAQFSGAPVENPGRGLTYDAVDRAGTVNLLAAIARVYGVAGTPGGGSTPAGGLTPGDGAPRFLYMSGISVSPRPATYWDQAKWQAEEAIRASRLDWTIVRCCWAFGPEDTALNRILHYSDYLPFVPIFGAGDGLLTPVFVDDIGRFFALLLEQRERSVHTTFGLGGPDEVTLVQFLRLALAAMHRQRPILRIPRSVGRMQGAVMQYLPGKPLSPGAVDFVSQPGAASAEDRRLIAERLPGFRTTPVGEGLSSYLGR